MRLRFALGSTIAALLLSSGALAAPTPAPDAAGDATSLLAQTRSDRAGATIIQLAAVTQKVAEIAATAVVGPPAGSSETVTPAEKVAVPERATQAADTAGTDIAGPGKTAAADDAAVTPEPVLPALAPTTKHAAKTKLAAKDAKRPRDKRRKELAIAGGKQICVRAVGKGETGTAAWYGGRYIGRRTSSGERLDTIHPTAAHRTLPLNSLARVTNLRNGRSVVVRVTDRGPMAESLLIDMSPRAAEELQMKQAGLVPVTVEQVVEVPPDSQ
jgi:rare lipoprotein A